jgi:hypothetical protein
MLRGTTAAFPQVWESWHSTVLQHRRRQYKHHPQFSADQLGSCRHDHDGYRFGDSAFTRLSS